LNNESTASASSSSSIDSTDNTVSTLKEKIVSKVSSASSCDKNVDCIISAAALIESEFKNQEEQYKKESQAKEAIITKLHTEFKLKDEQFKHKLIEIDLLNEGKIKAKETELKEKQLANDRLKRELDKYKTDFASMQSLVSGIENRLEDKEDDTE
jgi:hypothetical protein